MANHPSAEKRNRQRIKRTLRNRVARGSVRTAVKQARAAIAAGDGKAAAAPVLDATRALARAAGKGVLHARSAARTTSRLQSQLARLIAS